MHVDQSVATAETLPGFSRPFEKICRSDDRDWDEKNADKFASYLLLPEKIVNMYMKGVNVSDWSDIRELAEKFGVSNEAMKIRLQNLNFLYVDEEGKFFKSKAEFAGQRSLI